MAGNTSKLSPSVTLTHPLCSENPEPETRWFLLPGTLINSLLLPSLPRRTSARRTRCVASPLTRCRGARGSDPLFPPNSLSPASEGEQCRQGVRPLPKSELGAPQSKEQQHREGVPGFGKNQECSLWSVMRAARAKAGLSFLADDFWTVVVPPWPAWSGERFCDPTEGFSAQLAQPLTPSPLPRMSVAATPSSPTPSPPRTRLSAVMPAP